MKEIEWKLPKQELTTSPELMLSEPEIQIAAKQELETEYDKIKSKLEDKQCDLSDVYDQLRLQLQDALSLPVGTGIFFAPSLSCAQYMIILMHEILYPNMESFHHIITGDKVWALPY